MDLDRLKQDILGDWEKAIKRPATIEVAGIASINTTSLTCIGSACLDEFREIIETVVRENIPGHVVETGVWRGGACIWAAGVLENLGSDKLVYACDSYQGLPPPTHPKETIDFTGGMVVPLSEVQGYFDRFGLRHRAVFVEGWFRDTMPTLDIPVSVLRLDGDMYESTDDVLRSMYDRLSIGGYVIVDDYHLPSCKMAVDELRARKKVRGSLKVRQGTYWRKT